MKVTPIKDRVLLTLIDQTSTTDSGIILQTVKDYRGNHFGADIQGDTVLAIVDAVGPLVKTIKAGDKVFVHWHKGLHVNINNRKQILIGEQSISALITD
jgi:co-chaperonin GroES (HSP10)